MSQYASAIRNRSKSIMNSKQGRCGAPGAAVTPESTLRATQAADIVNNSSHLPWQSFPSLCI